MLMFANPLQSEASIESYYDCCAQEREFRAVSGLASLFFCLNGLLLVLCRSGVPVSDESRQLSASPFYKNTPGLCMIGDLIDPDSSASFCVDLDRRPR